MGWSAPRKPNLQTELRIPQNISYRSDLIQRSPIANIMFSSCFGSRRHRSDEQEPLLPQYDDDTSLQRRLHQKLHTYQMLRALSQGFMPSNEQAIANLRTLLSADILSPDNDQLSDSGRALTHYTKQWLKQFIKLLQHKNSHDQIQDFIWCLSKARVSIDMQHITERAGKAKSKADTTARMYHCRVIPRE